MRACGSKWAWPTLTGQSGGARDKRDTTREGDMLRQRVKGHGANSLARGHGRRKPDGSGRGRPVRALQVFDARSAHRARTNAANRKTTRTSGHVGLVSERDRRLVARWLGLG
jgi:hypothetical protein